MSALRDLQRWRKYFTSLDLSSKKKRKWETKAVRMLLKNTGITKQDEQANQLSGGESSCESGAQSIIRYINNSWWTSNPTECGVQRTHILHGLGNSFQQTFLIVTHNEEWPGWVIRVLHLRAKELSAKGILRYLKFTNSEAHFICFTLRSITSTYTMGFQVLQFPFCNEWPMVAGTKGNRQPVLGYLAKGWR